MLDRAVDKIRKIIVLWGMVVVALGTLGRATAVPGECRVPKGSNEAKLLAFYSMPVAFSPAGAPEHASGVDS